MKKEELKLDNPSQYAGVGLLTISDEYMDCLSSSFSKKELEDALWDSSGDDFISTRHKIRELMGLPNTSDCRSAMSVILQDLGKRHGIIKNPQRFEDKYWELKDADFYSRAMEQLAEKRRRTKGGKESMIVEKRKSQARRESMG